MKRITLFSIKALFALIFSTSLCLANDANSTVEGVYLTHGGQGYLQGKDGTLKLQYANPELARDVARLRAGDFISGRGQIVAGSQSVMLASLDTVGLKSLIGAWRSAQTGAILEFKDFFLLRLYEPVATMTVKATSHVATRVLNYTLAPDDKGQNRWSIFMADSQSLIIGSLEFGREQIWIKLYDPNSGKPTGVLELKPLR